MTNSSPANFKFLAGGGEMGARMRSFDWAPTLGPIADWPQSLKTSISLILNSHHPMWIGWGKDAAFLYNDAYIQVLSMAKHPWALGKPAAEVWPEIWNICGPLADKVFQKGEASFLNDVRLFMNRGEFLEETFYSFSYSPIRDESGNVGGLFCPSAEVTSKVLNTRRLRAVSELAAGSLVEKSTGGACASVAAILARSRDDIPFALIYLIAADGKSALLEQAIGLPKEESRLSPPTVDLIDANLEPSLWPIAEVVKAGRPRIVPLKGIDGFPPGAAGQCVAEAVVLPIVSHGQERPLGIMVAGINPTRKLDADYSTFFELVAGHVATAIQNARASEQEKKRADVLAELDRAKTTFFSNVSHELRTPLTLILGPLEDEIRESAVPRERLELAYRNSLRLLKLVNTLLDFSRLEAGRVEASFEPTNLAELTAELAGVFRSGIERAGLRLRVDCPPLSEPIYVDRDMWEKIVFNLLSNALKFTARGEIEVRLAEAEAPGKDGVCLSVRDTGIGIPPSEMPHIFERFHRTRNAWARSHEGTGIGLALVQELARLHGGSASAESAEGRGATFTVSIPRGLAHLPKERIGAPRGSASTSSGARPFVEEALGWATENHAANTPSRPAAHPEPGLRAEADAASHADGELPRARIVLADDNDDMRGYIQRLLAGQGYDVVAVGDGRAALEAARSRTPSLVLSDIMMPHLDGFGLLQELRNDPALKSIPIILLSARAGEEARVEGAEAGADDYLTKPFGARELLARVGTHLKLARVRRQAQESLLEREELLRRSESLYRAIGESIDYGVWVCEPDGRNTYASESFLKLLGITQQQCSNFGWGDALHPDDAGRTIAAWKECVRTGGKWDIEHRFRGVDGQWHYILARGAPVKNGQGEILYWAGINLDISRLKEAEMALAESGWRLRAIYDGTHEFIGLLTPEGTLMEANRASLTFADSKREDVVGLPFWETIWFQFTPGAPEAIQDAVRRAAAGEFVRFEVPITTPSGEIIIYDISLVPIRDESGRVIFIVPEGRDINELKRAENALREANAQLADKATQLETLVQQRTAKLRETIGELEAFSYSIAHDMRAPLRSLQGFSDILLAEYADKLDADGRRFLERIARSAGRMDKLIQDVLNYSRVVRSEFPLEPVDVGRLLHGIVDTYPLFAPENADISLEGPFPPVLGNEAMLTQVFSNLIDNAIKFIAPGVRPRVKVWAEPQARVVRLFVQDNGIGIEADQCERIFAIFQQVNRSFEGTGIGLAIVKKAVNRMGGRVGVQSELDRGSTFWIEIQRAEHLGGATGES